MKNLKFRYKYFWIIVSKWPSFHRLIRKNYQLQNNHFTLEYKQRLIISAVRGASFIYILSKSVNQEFNQQIALNTGILSALFDDLIEEGIEDSETIHNLITKPEKTAITSYHGTLAKELICELLSNLDDNQKSQLMMVLLQLFDIEHQVKTKHNGEWKMRGMYAFFVYITILHIPLEKVNLEVAGLFGEYLQLLDDYEDFKTDDPLQNFFRIYSGYDITEHYIHKIKPILSSIFFFEFNHQFFCEFIETYHIFQIRSFKNHHQKLSYFYHIKRIIIIYVLQKCNGNIPFFL